MQPKFTVYTVFWRQLAYCHNICSIYLILSYLSLAYLILSNLILSYLFLSDLFLSYLIVMTSDGSFKVLGAKRKTTFDVVFSHNFFTDILQKFNNANKIQNSNILILYTPAWYIELSFYFLLHVSISTLSEVTGLFHTFPFFAVLCALSLYVYTFSKTITTI